MTSQIFSESISWAPFSRLYLQGTINYVLDKTTTPGDYSMGATNLVQASKNNYWMSTLSAGYALNDRTDLTATYFYYNADNFNDNALYTQPYGASAEQHGVTVALSYLIKENMRWTIRYGYFTSHDETSDGHNDFDASVITTLIQYRF